jgi:hypothetical protein
MTENTGEPSAVEKLIAKSEMYDVLMRYCRGVDRDDPELVASVYWEDGYDDHGAMFQGPGWEFAKFFAGVPGRKKSAGAMHVIGNHYVEFEGPDLAFSEAYYITLGHTGSACTSGTGRSGTSPNPTTRARLRGNSSRGRASRTTSSTTGNGF